MSVDNFLDTNVIIYLFDETDAVKRLQAENLVRHSLESGVGCISYQVVQETLNVVTHKLGSPPERTRQLLDHVLIPLWQIYPTPSLYREALAFQALYRLGFYDSLIIAAALQAGCRRLYSEDMQHGLQIQGLTVLNPFAD